MKKNHVSILCAIVMSGALQALHAGAGIENPVSVTVRVEEKRIVVRVEMPPEILLQSGSIADEDLDGFVSPAEIIGNEHDIKMYAATNFSLRLNGMRLKPDSLGCGAEYFGPNHVEAIVTLRYDMLLHARRLAFEVGPFEGITGGCRLVGRVIALTNSWPFEYMIDGEPQRFELEFGEGGAISVRPGRDARLLAALEHYGGYLIAIVLLLVVWMAIVRIRKASRRRRRHRRLHRSEGSSSITVPANSSSQSSTIVASENGKTE